MVCKNLNVVIDQANTLITYQSKWIAKPHDNNSNMNFVVMAAILVCNAFASTHLVA